MTGRDLIMYILQNDLEDEPLINGEKILGFISEKELALKRNTGTETIRVLIKLENVESVNINGALYIPAMSSLYKGGNNGTTN